MILVAAMRVPLHSWADYDIFWHLSNGRLMVRDGVSPSPDRFSWTGAGRDVALHYVQADRILYLLWDWRGPQAMAMFSALLFLGALLPFALLVGRLGLKPLVEAGAMLILASAYLPLVGARPHLLGVWMLGILALVLHRPFGLKAAITAGIALGCWINLHGSFPVGFAFVGLSAAIWAYRRDIRSAVMAGGALMLGGVGAIVSPAGMAALKFNYGDTSHPSMTSINADWSGFRPFMLACAPMTILIAVALAIGVWNRLEPRTLVCLMLVIATLQYARFTVFAAPILLLEILDRLQCRTTRLTIAPGSSMAATIRRPIIAWGSWVMLAIGVLYTLMSAPSSPIEQSAMHPIPTEAVKQLIACGSPAPVWNDFNWGGYLIWKTDGRYLVSIDGRSTPTLDDLYSAEEFNDYIAVAEGRIGWEKLVQDSPAQYALLPLSSAPIGSLPGWHQVFADNVATLSVRDGAVWTCSATAQTGF
jgi:hypothetical protein